MRIRAHWHARACIHAQLVVYMYMPYDPAPRSSLTGLPGLNFLATCKLLTCAHTHGPPALFGPISSFPNVPPLNFIVLQSNSSEGQLVDAAVIMHDDDFQTRNIVWQKWEENMNIMLTTTMTTKMMIRVLCGTDWIDWIDWLVLQQNNVECCLAESSPDCDATPFLLIDWCQNNVECCLTERVLSRLWRSHPFLFRTNFSYLTHSDKIRQNRGDIDC